MDAGLLALANWLDGLCEHAGETTSHALAADLAAAIVLRLVTGEEADEGGPDGAVVRLPTDVFASVGRRAA
jgi:hypothetical protein